MDEKFMKGLKFVLQWEGGYSNHPADPGGATNKGVTQATYNEYRKDKGLKYGSVEYIKAVEVEEIYSDMYYKKSGAHNMPEKVSICLFDWAVNGGVSRAVKHLQRALGVIEDGKVGPKTIEAATSQNETTIAKKFLSIRVDYYNTRSSSLKSYFLKGWLNRVNALRKYISL